MEVRKNGHTSVGEEVPVNLTTWFLALLGSFLILFGAGATLLIFLSGTWGLGHGYPILILSIPLFMVGLWLLWFLKRTKRL